MIVTKIIGKLNLALFVIYLPTPDFKLYHKTLTEIVDHDIHALVVTSSAFDIVIACTIYDGSDKEQETSSPLFLVKVLGSSLVDIVKYGDISLQQLFHIKMTVFDNQFFAVGTGTGNRTVFNFLKIQEIVVKHYFKYSV